MELFTIIACGGSDYTNWEKMSNTLCSLCDEKDLWEGGFKRGQPNLASGLRIVAAGSPFGADRFIRDWAGVWMAHYQAYPADWARYGLRAVPVRNGEMLEAEKDRLKLVIAFPGGSGTADMVRRAEKAGVPVRMIR